jgi:hypothetical protein
MLLQEGSGEGCSRKEGCSCEEGMLQEGGGEGCSCEEGVLLQESCCEEGNKEISIGDEF